MTPPLLVDTGALLLALEGEEPWAGLLEDASVRVLPGLVLAEVDYHLRNHRPAMHRFLGDIDSGAYEYEAPTAADLVRARELDRKFKSTELGLVDATVAALAERTGIHRLLTIDSDFAVVRIGPRFQVALELVAPLPRRK